MYYDVCVCLPLDGQCNIVPAPAHPTKPLARGMLTRLHISNQLQKTGFVNEMK